MESCAQLSTLQIVGNANSHETDFVFFRALLTWTTRLKKQWRTLPVEFVPQKNFYIPPNSPPISTVMTLNPFLNKINPKPIFTIMWSYAVSTQTYSKKPAFLLHTFKQKIMQAYSWDIILLSYILSQTHKRLCHNKWILFYFHTRIF